MKFHQSSYCISKTANVLSKNMYRWCTMFAYKFCFEVFAYTNKNPSHCCSLPASTYNFCWIFSQWSV